MTPSEEFLDLYKNIEETLQLRYQSKANKRVGNPIMRFMDTPEGKRFKEELNLCREVRNLLSHHARFDGEDAVQPSQKLIDFLARLLRYLENPPNAATIATPLHALLRARKDDSLVSLLNRMEERGFSHVPVLEDNRLYGVLSVGTMFSYVKKNPDEPLGHDATVGRLWELLPVEQHINERFAFVSPDCPYESLRAYFNEGGPKKKRLAALFVTKNGQSDSALIGMMTPWDLLRVNLDN